MKNRSRRACRAKWFWNEGPGTPPSATINKKGRRWKTPNTASGAVEYPGFGLLRVLPPNNLSLTFASPVIRRFTPFREQAPTPPARQGRAKNRAEHMAGRTRGGRTAADDGKRPDGDAGPGGRNGRFTWMWFSMCVLSRGGRPARARRL